MALPSWTDTKLGTMKRAALWLVSVVGEGNTFTKENVKEAFPGVSQADRRVRDLRKHGWRIDTNREDSSLGQHEQRFVAQGEPVWQPGKGSVLSSVPHGYAATRSPGAGRPLLPFVRHRARRRISRHLPVGAAGHCPSAREAE